jgi:hypothetical protein
MSTDLFELRDEHGGVVAFGSLEAIEQAIREMRSRIVHTQHRESLERHAQQERNRSVRSAVEQLVYGLEKFERAHTSRAVNDAHDAIISAHERLKQFSEDELRTDERMARLLDFNPRLGESLAAR